MTKYPVEIRAKHRHGITIVSALIAHPMTSNSRTTDHADPQIQAHFIQEVICKHEGVTLLTAQWGAEMPKNPYISFSFKGGVKGGAVTLNWVDNRGGSYSAKTKIR